MSSKTPSPSVKRPSPLLFALLIVLVLLSVPLVLGFFGRVHPALDSFAHFRAHIAALMAIGGIILLFTSLRREAAMVTLLGLSAFSTTVNWSGEAKPAVAETDAVTYRLMQINLLQNNADPKALLQAVARNKPDIITYQEGSEQWQPWLKTLEGSYPYRHQCGSLPKKWGVGILSRRPFADFGTPVCTGDGVLATALVNLSGTNVLVSSLHQSWPWPFKQVQQFEMLRPALEPMANPHGIPVIIAGDFNAAPWSTNLRQYEMLTETKRIAGAGPTWLTTRLPDALRPWIGLPIDHILINETVTMRSIRTGEPIGSDHQPLLLEFSVPASASEPVEDSPQPAPNAVSI
ncbi:endonuclease/exonuclease/phosphatase family protein [Pseudochrobactrum sp. sp1633]|uniref:endonuclease/exonuclease/phosphatase family protein n=1 Tax=Pseudochrobactrum sp. sp1633 TaxID=3036706 RepID=UPI0025A5AA90|nr:endonuclease/exonuclease/phosphatase family protein [Pseudochrobactrum sp. sp1633]MDM8345145.1 endonuclease/exonuclease/phosphatase family protein [Pseudochrobactrum sp. sp1633]HWD13004.1 endonuclease/exonuclease/phosphatase family protein [Pseudochrobactrum sp.]